MIYLIFLLHFIALFVIYFVRKESGAFVKPPFKTYPLILVMIFDIFY